MPATRAASLLAGLLAIASFQARAQLTTLETERLRLVYLTPLQSHLAPYAARCFENSLAFQERVLGYRPWEPVSVLLSDLSDRGNASTLSVPRNYIIVETAPLSFAYETVAPNERLNWMMNHELVHISTVDQWAPSDRFFRRFFGGKVAPVAENPETVLYFFLTTPRDAAPRWYHEGIAVFIETWMAGGLGRAQGGYDEMVFRSMVRDGSRFHDPLGLVAEGTRIDFQTEVNSYLYGTRFVSYLAWAWSPDHVIRWIGRTAGSRRYYSSQFEEVFGRPLREVWQDWIEWEKEFQRRNLETIRRYPTTPHVDLSPRALGSVSRAFFDPETNRLYAGFNYPGVVAHLGAIDLGTGIVEKLLDIKDPVIYSVTSLAWDPDSRTIFYTTDNREHRDVRAVDPATRRSRTLLKDARIGELAYDRADRSLWGVRHFNGIATLVRIPFPYEEWEQVRSFPYGETLYDLDVSPDGRLISFALGDITGRHSLRIHDVERLREGDPQPRTVVPFENTIPSSFTFAPDNRHLYGSTYYTGVANIFRYDLETGALEAVTNTDTGFFRPIPLGGDSLIVFRYSGEGFVPARIEAAPLEDVSAITFLGHEIAEKHPIVKEWLAGSPADVDLDALVTDAGPYRGVRSIGVESFYPVVEGYKDLAAYGMRLNLSDPLSLNRLSFTASVTPNEDLPDDERLHLDFRFRRYNWRAALKLNDADFYDLFGPTKVGLKGYSASLGYDRLLLYDRPRRMDLSVDGAFYGNLERLPAYQNVAAPAEDLAEVSTRLEYSNVRSSLGHVDDEKGHRWEVVAAATYVDDDLIPSIRGAWDFGFALPLPHSSFWIRNAAGTAFGDREDPFANFFFGGFGNNYVDHGEVKRYREFYALPGLELNQVGGRSYGKMTLEWNLPPLRFRNAGTPGSYFSWARASLFASGLATDLDDGDLRREIGSVGAQVDFLLTVLSRLEMTLSVGYAQAVEKGLGPRDEIMFSLKILH